MLDLSSRRAMFFSVLLAVQSIPASAQWLNLPADRAKPNLAAAAPRKADGKPDLSGIWTGDEQNLRYVDLAADFKPGQFHAQPWAEALSQERTIKGLAWPPAHCLPPSLPMLDAAIPTPFKIVQETGLMVILYEAFGQVRQVFLDGRRMANNVNPTWLGYSSGTWDGDVMVVDSTGFNGKAWLDLVGHPATDALHITERFRRRDFGHLDLQITIDDPKAYANPWTVALPLHLSPDTEIMEFVCNENEADVKHMVTR